MPIFSQEKVKLLYPIVSQNKCEEEIITLNQCISRWPHLYILLLKAVCLFLQMTNLAFFNNSFLLLIFKSTCNFIMKAKQSMFD